MVPHYSQFYEQLCKALEGTKVKLGKPNHLARGLIVDFLNPQTNVTEQRILDHRLGMFVQYPRQDTFAIYMGHKIVFQAQREPMLSRVLSSLHQVVSNLEAGRAWNARETKSETLEWRSLMSASTMSQANNFKLSNGPKALKTISNDEQGRESTHEFKRTSQGQMSALKVTCNNYANDESGFKSFKQFGGTS